MKLSVLLLGTGASLVAVIGQGTVNFSNGAAGVNAPVHFSEVQRDTLNAYKVTLYHEGEISTAVASTSLGGSEIAGYFFGGMATVPGVMPGQVAKFKVSISSGEGKVWAESDVLEIVLGGDKVPPPNLVGLKELSLPEPVSLQIAASSEEVTLTWSRQSFPVILEVATDPRGPWATVQAFTEVDSHRFPSPNAIRFYRLLLSEE